MSSDQLAELSRVLYFPTTLLLYLAAALFYLYALTTTVGRSDQRERGRRARQVGAALTVLGIATHVAHEIVRGLAQDRLPLGNMFEVSSLMALVGVVVGWSYLNFVRKRPELSGFVLLGGALVLGMAMLMYAEPGPLMPILDTWWRPFHVSLLVGAMGILGAAFVFMSLYLLRDTADRHLARAATDPGGAAALGGGSGTDAGGPGRRSRDADATPEVLTGGATAPRTVPDTATATAPGQVPVTVSTVADPEVTPASTHGTDTAADVDQLDEEALAARRAAMRAAVRAAVPAWRLAIGTFVGTSLVSWVWWYAEGWSSAGLTRFLTVNLVMVAAALLARWFVPYLPAGETLDGLAHRTVAFGFVMWTVGTIAGAMWAEVSWGRFWGWDPKETGAFLTWVAYAAYLHARATRGVKGRRAAWIGIGAFVVLMGTYLIANYVIVGLHSYADL